MSDTSPLQLCTLGRAVGGLTRPSCGVQGTPRQARSGGAGQARLSGHRAPQQRTQAPPGTPGADGVPCALQTRCERCCGPVRPRQATRRPSPHGRGRPGTDQPPGACLGLQARRPGVIGSRLKVRARAPEGRQRVGGHGQHAARAGGLHQPQRARRLGLHDDRTGRRARRRGQLVQQHRRAQVLRVRLVRRPAGARRSVCTARMWGLANARCATGMRAGLA